MKRASLPIFFLGILLGSLLYGYAVWADLEASLFESDFIPEETLRGFSCPLAVNSQETGLIRGRIVNTTGAPLNVLVRAQITRGSYLLERQEEGYISLAPGESRLVEYSFTAKDRVWNRFIFARLNQYRAYPMASRGGACGVLVLNFAGLSGNAVFALLIALSLLLAAAGIWLWARAHQPLMRRPRNIAGGMLTLTLLILLGTLAAALNSWALGLVCAVGSLLLILVLSSEAFQAA